MFDLPLYKFGIFIYFIYLSISWRGNTLIVELRHHTYGRDHELETPPDHYWIPGKRNDNKRDRSWCKTALLGTTDQRQQCDCVPCSWIPCSLNQRTSLRSSMALCMNWILPSHCYSQGWMKFPGNVVPVLPNNWDYCLTSSIIQNVMPSSMRIY